MADFRAPLDKDSARDGGTSGRPTETEQPVSAPSTISTPVARIAPEVLEEFGVSRIQQLAGHIEDARRELMEGMKLVDRPDERDLHVFVGQIICSIDDLREHMAQFGGGEQS